MPWFLSLLKDKEIKSIYGAFQFILEGKGLMQF